MNRKKFSDISVDVWTELQRAYDKHVEDNPNRPNLFVSYTILAEEVGEVAKAIIDEHFNGTGTLQELRVELLQVAAMAAEMVAEVDRRCQKTIKTGKK